MADITYSVQEEYDSVESLDAVLMDNTAVNTDFAGGLCACLEKKLSRMLHLIDCFLHINELPLSKIIKELDGPTKSANKFSGKIGQQLMKLTCIAQILFTLSPYLLDLAGLILQILRDSQMTRDFC